MSEVQPIGRFLAKAPDPLGFVAAENGRFADHFEPIDDLLFRLLAKALDGERLIEAKRKKTENCVQLIGLSAADARLISGHFDRSSLQSKGAWWLPDEASLRPVVFNLPGALIKGHRFAAGYAGDDSLKLELDNPEHLFSFYALQPLMQQIFAPLELRGHAAGKKKPEQRVKAWVEVETLYGQLGLPLDNGYMAVRNGQAWATKRLPERSNAKRAYLEAFRDRLAPDVVQHYRAVRLQELVTKYYAKSKKVSATQRQVLTKPLQQPLVTYFAGGWLDFLEYLGEEPSPDEEITTALPGTKLYVGGSDRVDDIAAERGLAPEAVEEMLASFFGESAGRSPVERRVEACRKYWQVFDELHAAQRPGMDSLWGLVDEGGTYSPGQPSDPYQPSAIPALLPREVAGSIEELWGTAVLKRWPDSIVSATHPHANFAEAFGVALEFWHGVGLTAWFICEGPYSRTSIDGLPGYYERH